MEKKLEEYLKGLKGAISKKEMTSEVIEFLNVAFQKLERGQSQEREGYKLYLSPDGKIIAIQFPDGIGAIFYGSGAVFGYSLGDNYPEWVDSIV